MVIDTTYRSHVDGWPAGDVYHAFRPYSNFSFEGVRNFVAPEPRTEYVSIGDSRWWHLAWASMANESIFGGEQDDPIVTYPRRGKSSATWFEQPMHPGIIRTYEVGVDNGEPVVRSGNTITGFVPEFVDPFGRYGFAGAAGDSGEFRLFEDGDLIATAPFFRGDFAVSGDPATYRAELDVTRSAAYWTQSTRTETRWTFESAPPAAGATESVPLLLVDYSLGELDLLNQAPRGPYEIDLSVHRQQGAPESDVASLRVWSSFNDGGTWRRLPVTDLGNGSFSAAVTNPAAVNRTHVALRVTATDDGGSAITQTIYRAYGLQ
jgi:hypothetical protein